VEYRDSFWYTPAWVYRLCAGIGALFLLIGVATIVAFFHFDRPEIVALIAGVLCLGVGGFIVILTIVSLMTNRRTQVHYVVVQQPQESPSERERAA